MADVTRRLIWSVLALAACAEEPASRPADAPAAPAAPVADSMPVAPVAPAPFVSRDSVVYVFEVDEWGYIMFEPLYVVDSTGVVSSPPGEIETVEGRAFAQRHLVPGHRFTLMSDGRRIGTLAIDSVGPGACVGFRVMAHVLDSIPPLDRRGVAFRERALDRSQAGDWLIETTSAEDSIARALALDQLRRQQVPEDRLDDVTWEPVRIVEGGFAPRTLVTAAEVYPDENTDVRISALVLVESSGERPPIEDRSASFFDAADLDGDGTPEIIVRGFGYESYDFTIYRYEADGWRDVFTGGGNGC